MKYDSILWDLDDTLLNFKYSEKKSLIHAFECYHLPITEEMISCYSKINESFWRQLERGEITKGFLLKERFHVLFKEYNLTGINVDDFEKKYREGLCSFLQFEENGQEVLNALYGKIPQYLVTNGVKETQMKKLEKSGIGSYMDGIFISEDIGAEKPSSLFFDTCFSILKPKDKSRVLLIGDSLTSDIQGGIGAGIHTCWYHKKMMENNTQLKPNYEIFNLEEVYNIVL